MAMTRPIKYFILVDITFYLRVKLDLQVDVFLYVSKIIVPKDQVMV